MATVRPPLTGAALGGSPDDFQVHSIRPAVRFLSRGVQPPSNVYVTADDDITIGVASSQPNEVVTVTYRLLDVSGNIVPGQFVVKPASDRSITVHSESLCEGFLLSVSCKAAVATTRGQTFARIFLSNPALGLGQPSYMLMADYVTTAMAPAFPNGRQLAPSEGPGNLVSYVQNGPAAGADWIVNVPTNARWRLRHVNMLFTTAIGGGVRTPELLVLAAPASGLQCVPRTTQAAGLLVAYYGGNLVYDSGIDPATNTWVFPRDMFLLTGGLLLSQTLGIQAGDQWGTTRYAVEEWLDNV